MIIFGVSSLDSTLETGAFSCPRCNSQQPNRVVGVNRWFTLFFIPVIPLGRKGVYVECQSCAGTFSTEVLQPIMTAELASEPTAQATPTAAVAADPPFAQGGFQSPGRNYPTTSGMAVTSMILSLFSPLLCFFGAIPAFVAVLLSCLSLSRIKGSDGMVKGSGFAYVGMVLGCGWIVFSGVMIVSFLVSDSSGPGRGDLASGNADRSADRLRDAENKIRTDHRGVAHGNTKEARALAEQFSTRLGILRKELFTEGSDGASLSGGKFITYCRVSSDRCVFLVHVPEYRKYSDDAKDALATTAWVVAQDIVQSELPEVTEVGLGMKGVLLYGSVMTGDVHSEEPSLSSTDSERLERFFEPSRRKLDAKPKAEPEIPIDDLESETSLEPSSNGPVLLEMVVLKTGLPINVADVGVV